MARPTVLRLDDLERPHWNRPGEARPVPVSLWLPPSGGPHPLVLLSHGTGGSAAQLGWLADALTAAGFAAAGVDHHGNNSTEPYAAEGFARIWDRPRDLSVAMDTLAADRRLDPGRVGAAGFSLGGYTVAALLGARLSPERLRLLSEHPEIAPLPEYPTLYAELRARLSATELAALFAESAVDRRDARVRCGLLLAPIGAMVDPASLGAAHGPLRVLWADADDNAPAELHAAPYLDRAPAATGRSLGATVGHYAVVADPPVRAAVAAEAVRFFTAALGPPG